MNTPNTEEHMSPLPSTQNAPSERSADIFNETDLIERVMGNEDLARRVAAKFLQGIPGKLADLSAAIHRGDARNTRCIAHAVRGAAANLSAEPLSDIASKLEALGETGDLKSSAALLPELLLSFDKLKSQLVRFCDAGRLV
jgi:HPt (histidine-containing phosphotransfer) domain-containing protein